VSPRIGYRTRRLLRDPVAELQSAAAAGFDHVEFAIRSVEPDAPYYRQDYPAGIRRAAGDLGLTVSAHCKGGIDLGCRIPRVRRVYLDIYRTMLEFCVGSGARWLTVHLGRVTRCYCPSLARRRLAIAAESIAELVPAFSQAGVVLGLENLCLVDAGARMFNLGTSPDELEPIIRAHPPGAVGLVLDVGHANVLAGPAAALGFLDRLGDRLVAVHLHANDGQRDLHAGLGWPELAPSWKAALERIVAGGCDVPMVLEVGEGEREGSRGVVEDFSD